MVACGLAVRLAVMPFLMPDLLDPSRDHWALGYEAGRIARALLSGRGFSDPLFAETGPTAWLTPVYPFLVAGVFKVFGIYSEASAVVLVSLNALFSSLTCLPVYFFARRSFGARVAFWSGWTWALFPYAVYFSVQRIWETSLVTLLLAVLFLMTLQLEESGRTKVWIGFGLLWGLAALTSPSVLSLLPFLGVWICYRLSRKRRRWFMPAVAGALAFIAVVTPWFVRNYRTFHAFVPFRDTLGLELYMGNHGDTSHWFVLQAGPWVNESEWQKFQQQGEIVYFAEKRAEALEYILNHRGGFALATLRRAGWFWTGFWSFNRQYLAIEYEDVPNIFFCTTLSVLALWGLWRAFRRKVFAATPLAIALFCFPLIYYITHGEFWYRRPDDPYFVVLAVYAIVTRKEAFIHTAEGRAG